MTAIDQREQPGATIPQDFDHSAVESLSVERNTKGYNWKIRVVVRPGEALEDAHARLVRADRDMRYTFGQ